MGRRGKRLLRGVGWGVCGLCTVLALYRSLSVPGPTPPPRRLSAEEHDAGIVFAAHASSYSYVEVRRMPLIRPA